MGSVSLSWDWINGRPQGVSNIDEAIASCSRSQLAWAKTNLAERKSIVAKAADLLEQERQVFQDTFQEEAKVSPRFADFNVSTSINMFKELLSVVDSVLKPQTLNLEHGEYALTSRVPFGTVLAIAPWNAAIILSCRALLTPILCGNSCLLKGSELTPRTHLLWGDLFKRAGLPDGVLNIIIIPTEQAATATEQLISDPRIRHVNFTGSTTVGRIIGGLCGKNLKPVILELGGKAAAIVLEDANLEVAASQCLLGGWLNQGQICMSTERVLVVESVYDQFVEVLRRVASNSGLRKTQLSLITPQAVDKYQALIADALSAGAELLFEDITSTEGGSGPTILVNVTPKMRIFSEETFAHTFYVLKVASAEEAVEISNASHYGLSSSIFSENIDRAMTLGNMVTAGATHINAMTVQDEPNVPHGGMKDSGFGRFNGVEGLMSFTQIKVLTVHKGEVAHV